MILGPVAYHDYQVYFCVLRYVMIFKGILVDEEERASLVSDLGDKNIMILRNHGFVVCGSTIEEAFSIMYHLILACETQANNIVYHQDYDYRLKPCVVEEWINFTFQPKKLPREPGERRKMEQEESTEKTMARFVITDGVEESWNGKPG